MDINTILILLLLAASVIALVYYLKKTSTINTDIVEYENTFSLEKLEDKTNETLNITLQRSLSDMNLDAKEYARSMANKEELKSSRRTAAYGDKSAKRFMCLYIKDTLTDQKIGKLNPINILNVIPFDDYNAIKSRDKWEILTYLWIQDGPTGFSDNFCKFGLHKPKKTEYGNVYEVTKEDCAAVFAAYMDERHGMTYNERIGYITQRVFQDIGGLGAVDLLLETDIDEVQGGSSGIPAESFDIELNKDVMESQEISYSFEAIWIVFKGLNIHLSCTTFGTQSELVRVCRNIYRYDAPTILNEKDAKVVGAMKNGNRISVMCPNFSDSYAFLARKFDSTPSIAPENLLKTKEAV